MTEAERGHKRDIAVHCLSELLDLLHPDPNPDVFTLESFMYVYKLHGLSETAVTHIEQSQRVNRSLGNFKQMGLNELHVGLIYLFWGEYHAAEKQFDSARRQWAIDNDTAASLSLAHLGCGFAQELAYHYEAAMRSYSRARQGLDRVRFATPSEEYGRFRQIIEQCIDDAQRTLREIMRPLPERGTVDFSGDAEEMGNIPPPISNLSGEPMPIEGHVRVERQYHWYEVEEQTTPELLPQVQPGDWLLVYTQPEADVAALPENQPITIVYESEEDSAIVLKPHQTPTRPSPGQRIHLQKLTVQTGPFVIEGDSAIFTREEEQIAIDLSEILGVVVGFWRPVGTG